LNSALELIIFDKLMKMKNYFITVIILILISNCKKDELKPNPDNILYHKFEPTVKIDIHSSSLDIDIDSNKIIDFRIEHNWGIINCGKTTEFCADVNILGLNISDSICDTIFYDTTSFIQSNIVRWYNRKMLYSLDYCHHILFEVKDSYIGIKINNNYGWIHIAPIDNYYLEIKEYALNLTENNDIRVGQKE
jgi:hypothetical protein